MGGGGRGGLRIKSIEAAWGGRNGPGSWLW
jgi:hypothetical protein